MPTLLRWGTGNLQYRMGVSCLQGGAVHKCCYGKLLGCSWRSHRLPAALTFHAGSSGECHVQEAKQGPGPGAQVNGEASLDHDTDDYTDYMEQDSVEFPQA